MADTKITALTALTAADPANDVIPIVDVSDTSMAASGTTKKISVNNILGASGTATLASATITGAATVGTTLGVTGVSTLASVGVTGAATVGTTLGVTGVSTFAAGTALLPALTTTGDTNTGIYYPAADTFAITTGGSERVRVNSSGNLTVARTGAGLDNTSGVTIGQSSIGMQTEGNAIQIIANRTTSDGVIVDIRRNNVTVGTIAVTTLATTYNSISDYRLKEAVQPLVGGLARVSALKPSIYKWKVNGSNGEGFIAHELADVVPAAVTGEKDAVNEDGTVNPQGVDLSKVVPILVAAIQELTAEVNALKNA